MSDELLQQDCPALLSTKDFINNFSRSASFLLYGLAMLLKKSWQKLWSIINLVFHYLSVNDFSLFYLWAFCHIISLYSIKALVQLWVLKQFSPSGTPTV